MLASHVTLLLVLAAAPPTATTDAARPAEARQALERVVNAHIDHEDGLTRADGYVYAIDVGLLALSSALSRDRVRYQRLVELARAKFVVERPPGFADAPVVVWRRQLAPRNRPDASGTTEALQLAQALLVGAEAFERSGDARLARRLLQGYAAHAGVVNDVWIIRNYYNLGTRTFATNSYLIDYAPDVLAHASRHHGLGELQPTIDKSVALVRKATRPNGLIDTLVMPELATISPLVVFSPNDVIELEHAALVAEQVVETAPDIARRTLAFVRDRLATLHGAYLGASGTVVGPDKADAGTLSAVARLAVKLDDRAVVEGLRPHLAAHAMTLASAPATFDVHVAAQTLLGLHFLELWQERKPLPLAVTARSGGL